MESENMYAAVVFGTLGFVIWTTIGLCYNLFVDMSAQVDREIEEENARIEADTDCECDSDCLSGIQVFNLEGCIFLSENKIALPVGSIVEKMFIREIHENGEERIVVTFPQNRNLKSVPSPTKYSTPSPDICCESTDSKSSNQQSQMPVQMSVNGKTEEQIISQFFDMVKPFVEPKLGGENTKRLFDAIKKQI